MNKLNLKAAVAATFMVLALSAGAEGSGTSFTFSDGGTTSNYAGNVQNDISTSSNGTVGAQYNCASGANCGAGSGASSATQFSSNMESQTIQVQQTTMNQVFRDVYTDDLTNPTGQFEQIQVYATERFAVLGEDGVQLQVNGADAFGTRQVAIPGMFENGDPLYEQIHTEVAVEGKFTESLVYDVYGNPVMEDKDVKVGKNSLDVQLEISENQKETTTNVVSVPSMQAPMVNASNSDMCRHGVSGAMSQLGLGISGGMTLVDKNCEMLKQVRLLNNLGLRDIALAMLAQDSRIADAMRTVDSKRYGRYMNKSTETNLEDISANAETNANGKEIKHSEPGETNWNFGG